jgi:hypothetical protein
MKLLDELIELQLQLGRIDSLRFSDEQPALEQRKLFFEHLVRAPQPRILVLKLRDGRIALLELEHECFHAAALGCVTRRFGTLRLAHLHVSLCTAKSRSRRARVRQ